MKLLISIISNLVMSFVASKNDLNYIKIYNNFIKVLETLINSIPDKYLDDNLLFINIPMPKTYTKLKYQVISHVDTQIISNLFLVLILALNRVIDSFDTDFYSKIYSTGNKDLNRILQVTTLSNQVQQSTTFIEEFVKETNLINDVTVFLKMIEYLYYAFKYKRDKSFQVYFILYFLTFKYNKKIYLHGDSLKNNLINENINTFVKSFVTKIVIFMIFTIFSYINVNIYPISTLIYEKIK